MVFENGILRRIYGPVFDENTGEWRRRHNQELRDLSSLTPITNVIRSMRLRWAGHVARMDEDRTARWIAFGTPNGTRPLGRPRKRWRDNLRETLISLGVDNPDDWWELAENRSDWRRLVKAARDHLGPEPAE